MYISLSVSKGPHCIRDVWKELRGAESVVLAPMELHSPLGGEANRQQHTRWKEMWWKTKMSCAEAKWCRSSGVQRTETSVQAGEAGKAAERRVGGFAKLERGVSVSWGCPHTVPQPGWLTTTEMDSVTFCKLKSEIWGVSRAALTLKSTGESPFLPWNL